jgi:lipid-A-disaccharide synthase
MHLFVSAGDPSGDLHGANLVHSLRGRHPGLAVSCFGGDQMAAAGCELLYPLCDLGLIGLMPVLRSLPQIVGLLRRASRFFREQRPDAVVLIDYPSFHWWLARAARAQGIPVYYFVAPQLWAWAGWRVRKMRRLVDHVLCTLPFEEAWYRQRGVPASYVGHPYFDELAGQRLDAPFVARQRALPGTVVGLLPGSRPTELRLNLADLYRAASLVHRRRPDARFLVACLRPPHAEQARALLANFPDLPVEVHAGRTPEVIHLAHSCIACSGSVGLELLYRSTPAAVTYRLTPLYGLLKPLLMNCPHASLVNLLAGRELLPEFISLRNRSEALAGVILGWLNDRTAHETLCGELTALARRVARPGACDRAADTLLALLHPSHSRAA